MATKELVAEDSNRRVMALPDYRIEAITKLIALGTSSPEQIAETCSIDLKRLMALIKRKSNKKFTKRLEYWKGVMAKHHTGAVMDIVEKIPAASSAVDRALDSEDTRLASDTAWKVYEAVGITKKHSGNGDGTPAVQVNLFANPQAVSVLTESVSKVGSTLVELRSYMEGEGVIQSHELIGADALPVPPGQQEIREGDALPNEDDVEDALYTTLMPARRE